MGGGGGIINKRRKFMFCTYNEPCVAVNEGRMLVHCIDGVVMKS
jgi:hypothetical protein